MDLSFIQKLFEKKKPKLHMLKWGLPEQRLVAEVKDADKTVYALKKNKAKFVSGGEFIDRIHAKQLGETAFTYFIVRTEKKTENETILFDGYMAQEEEQLNLQLQNSYSIEEDLDNLGYAEAVNREVIEWRFNYSLIKASVFEIDGFGSFIEIAIPKTKLVRTRENQEKQAFELLEKIGIKKEEAIPTDVITLQLVQSMQEKK
ncbi:hypothetical protein HUU53_01385 [Candidatus Micrarchaeota archaeon]|nr:hypothetical protein [Candidatus Micrarchaeota archaeon]